MKAGCGRPRTTGGTAGWDLQYPESEDAEGKEEGDGGEGEPFAGRKSEKHGGYRP